MKEKSWLNGNIWHIWQHQLLRRLPQVALRHNLAAVYLWGCQLRKSCLFAAVAAAGCALALPALAQGTGGYSWSGAYVGAAVGGNWGSENDNLSVSEVPPCENEEGCDFDSFNLSGFGAGVYLGYSWEAAPWVFGIEGALEVTNLSGSKAFGGNALNFSSNVQGSVRGRIGYPIEDNLLLYLDAGLAFANGQANATLFGTAYSATASHTGGTVGVGLEYAFAPNWSLRGELQYTSFGAQNYMIAGAPVSIGWNQTVATIGLGYRF
jgi:outer membrane immunogenic protein